MSNDDAKLFLSIGLKQTIKKKEVIKSLKACITEANVTNGCDSIKGNLIYDVATSKKMNNNNALKRRKTLLAHIINNDIKTTTQLNEAYKYISCKKFFDENEFKKACGVGIIVSESEIITAVDTVITKYSDQLSTKGKSLLGLMYAELRKEIKWADGKLMNKIFNNTFNIALKSSGWDPKKIKKKIKKKPVKDDIKANDDDDDVITMDKWLTSDDNEKWKQGRDLPTAHNTASQLKQKEDGLKKIGLINKNITTSTFLSRFPPEPNGFLHIGHCKAMTFNFTLAEKKGGYCYLRFDDTNPSTEKQLYIDNIIENVKWMGFKPWKISYSSKYFKELYDLAVKMIKNGDAYVCHQTGDQIEAERKTFRAKKPQPSPWRDRPISENLSEFELMKCGYYAEGEACLRMKGDYNSPNPNMWDHVAYRIVFEAHPISGDKWCIYPTYDYTHCIIDSLEFIAASCCTLEFENRRESYFWLLDVLDIYKPVVWEYSRLNITYNVLSKRKLLILVNKGFVRGWDDCRMLTINGLRRRGYTSTILRDFCNLVGVTRKDNFISPKLLQSCARKEFNLTCSRAMAVINPLKIIITNYSNKKIEDIECLDFPQKKNKSTKHNVKFNRIIYIDKSDFKSGQINNKKYFGLTEGKTIRLKYAYNIKCNKVVYSKRNPKEIDHLECEYDPDHKIKIKRGHLTWVSSLGKKAEFRLYDHLFKVEMPGGSNWLNQLNENSEIISSGFVDDYVINTYKEKKRYQFERFGYFVVDTDDSNKCGYPVFNRTVTLSESSSKKASQGKGGRIKRNKNEKQFKTQTDT